MLLMSIFNYISMASCTCTCIIVRLYLETKGLYDKRRLITKQENGDYSIPVILDHTKHKDNTTSKHVPSDTKSEISDPKSLSIDLKSPSIDLKSPSIDPETLLKDHPLLASCRLVVDEATVFTRKQPLDIEVFIETIHSIINDIDHLLKEEDKELLPSFLSQLPSIKIHRHSDLVLLSKGGSTHQLWNRLQSIYPPLWTVISLSLHCSRIAVSSIIKPNGYRSPNTGLVLGTSGWVEAVDNGVKYVFDVTQCMFSRGNITEKMRMGSLDCRGETVVDLYAGERLYMYLDIHVCTCFNLANLCPFC